MVRTDVVVIGAGLLGCFTARNLRKYNTDVIVLEKESDVCRGISRANTGIIYPGYDTKPGTTKHKLCVQACMAFSNLCKDLGVKYEQTGSLMVAYGPEGAKTIRKKYDDGIAGGIEGLQLLNGEETMAIEPLLSDGVELALLSKTAGTVNPWELGIAAYENARDNGAQFVFDTRVVDLRQDEAAWIVETEDETYSARVVVNAAGLYSDKVREMVKEPLIRIRPSAADYIVLDRCDDRPIKHIIQHEAEDGKGLTLVPTVDGSILVGPTNRDVEEPEVDYRTSSEGLDELRSLCAEVVPGLDLGKQIRSFGSLRPNAYMIGEEDKSLHDFNILDEEGLISLIGIKTPGLTFSNELGKLVTEKTCSYLGKTAEVNASYNPVRKAPTVVAGLSLEERAKLIAENPNYGEIICDCMGVSKAEVLDAIARGARDFEGIRRRTGIGMGSCQGCRCKKRVIDILEGSK